MSTAPYDALEHARILYAENLRLRELLTLVAHIIDGHPRRTRRGATTRRRWAASGAAPCWAARIRLGDTRGGDPDWRAAYHPTGLPRGGKRRETSRDARFLRAPPVC